MAQFPRTTGRLTVAISLAASLLLANMPLSFAGPGDTNSTNFGENVAGGTYYNTAGDRTTFTNTGDITVGAGTTVRGLEVNNTGDLTGNGGHLHFDAQGGVLRVDGTIDAGAALGPNGAFLGNGGKVTIDAGALEQNGNILFPGLNGGMLVTNVGTLTLGPNARIEGMGTGPNGLAGQINLNATGQVTIPNGAVIDASGNYIGGYNANVIQISGSVVNLDGVVMANGLSAGAKGGAIGIYGSEIAVKNNAKILANGADGGEGGAINIAATNQITVEAGAEIAANGGKGANGGAALVGAALDQNGDIAILSKTVQNDGLITANGGDATDSANAGNGGVIGVVASDSLINSGQISANGGNGFSGVNAGNGGITLVGSNGNSINNGVISSNGGNGFNGYSPSDGGEGGLVEFAGNTVENNGRLTANGGNGGTNPNIERGPVVDGSQVSIGQPGGKGGNGGAVVVTHSAGISNAGGIEVTGGNGGNGQEAIADAYGVHQVALAGNGGDAGNGGLVRFYGEPGQDVLNNVNVNGGSGGNGGSAAVQSDCGCATPGSKGACGAPGQIEIIPKPPFCYGGHCSPPPPPPETPPLFPLYPKEYGNLGDTLPPNAGNVLSYTRSIFLARSPLPIIQKKAPPPPPPAPAKVMIARPKPKPPQKKVPVRGYW